MALSVGTHLGPYEILAPLGQGGMGDVYRARDPRLGRDVAIKVVREDRAGDSDSLTRFEKEARAIAALSHPNILAIHDFGAEGEMRYAVTELLEGETLRGLLAKETLHWRRVAELGAEVADGLAVAHAKGIVHRDLKPENVFVTEDGRVKILDFGLARVTARAPETNLSSAPTMPAETLPGTVVGTVGYMAPEQVRGGEVDARSDLFSLGCVLYELLSGVRAFPGNAVAEVLAGILRDEPGSPPGLEVRVPSVLWKIVLRCLEKSPNRRYQSARDLAADLRNAGREEGFGKASPVVARPTRTAPALRKAIDSIAVLPFEHDEGDTALEYLCDGLPESVIDRLSTLPRLRVMARSTVFRFRGRGTDPVATGRELGVRAVLSGQVSGRDSGIVVRVELVDANDGSRLWGARYEKSGGDLVSLQEEIAGEVSDKLRIRLSGEQKKRLKRRHTESQEAWQAYLKGRYHWARRPAGLRKAIEYFRETIGKDPAYALPYVGLADCYNSLGSWEAGALDPREAMPKSRAAAEKALEIDRTLGEAHTALAYSRLHFDRDWKAAGAGFERALHLGPGYAAAHHWQSHYFTAVGLTKESLAASLRALELDPLDVILNAHMAWHFQLARQYDHAREAAEKTLELDSNSPWPHFFLGWALEQTGDLSRAASELGRAVDLANRSTVMLGALGHALAATGDRAGAEDVLRELREKSKQKYVASYEIGLIRAALGETDEAFACFEMALEEHSGWLVYLKAEPRVDALRSDSRFVDLLRRAGHAT